MFEKPPFSKEEEQRILEAIKAAELNTSGEIRLHVEPSCKSTTLDRAAQMFDKLGMNKTEQRNGVLVYLALNDRKFAIIGDKGINEKVPQNFWEQTKDLMSDHFRKGNIVEGIIEGIVDAGEQLKQYFPYHQGGVNELKDDISYGKHE
ncbi:MAG: TPM domain-containing protein [Flavobacteriales bacterium]